MENRKIAVVVGGLTEAHRERISGAAQNAGFEALFAKRDAAELAECEVIFGYVARDVLKSAAGLKWLHVDMAGVDVYTRADSALPGHVALTNSVGAFGISIAEHLLMMAMMLLRKMGEYGRLQAQSKWQRLGNISTIYKSTVAVVGVGDLGGNFAARCKALGATVYGVSRRPRAVPPGWADAMYEVADIDEAIKHADIVALCMPSTPETAGLFDAGRLAAMKKGAILLNAGRGSAIDQDALVDALKSGHLGGAGLDVTSPEPLPEDSPLWLMPNVVITPHISGDDSQNLAHDLMVDKFLRYLADYAAGRPFEHVVDREIGY